MDQTDDEATLERRRSFREAALGPRWNGAAVGIALSPQRTIKPMLRPERQWQQRGTKRGRTKFRRMHRDEPAITLRCGEIFFHPTEDRYLTIREYMRIHTYPDDYLLKGPMRGRSGRVRDNHQYRQVANSVPPLIAATLAEALYETLTCQPSLNSLAIP